MSQKTRAQPRQRIHRQGTIEALVNQGLEALDTPPLPKYHADWRHLLERLETLASSTSPGVPKSNETPVGDSGFPMDAVADDTLRRCVFNTKKTYFTVDAPSFSGFCEKLWFIYSRTLPLLVMSNWQNITPWHRRLTSTAAYGLCIPS
jgi:hypothetical protein